MNLRWEDKSLQEEDRLCNTIAREGSVELMEWAIGVGFLCSSLEASMYAARYGNVEILDYHHRNGHIMSYSDTLVHATEYGIISSIQWCLRNFMTDDTDDAMSRLYGYLCILASEKGHLHVLKLIATLDKVPPMKEVIRGAGMRKDIDMLRWLHDEFNYEYIEAQRDAGGNAWGYH